MRSPLPFGLAWAQPRVGLRLGLALLCGALVLGPGLVTAELIARGYERVLVADAHTRAVAGLDGVVGLVQQETVRTLDNAEVVAERLGPVVDAEPNDSLVQAAASVRAAIRATSLVAVVDGTGRTLASDPASNLAFGNGGDVRAALKGKSSVGLQDRVPVAVEAAAPLRRGGEPVAGAAVVAVNLDDAFLNAASRVSGLEVALVQTVQGTPRAVAASRGLRRSLSFAADTSVSPDLLGPSTFASARLGSDTFLLASRVVSAGNGQPIGTLLVGVPAEGVAAQVHQARVLADAAAVVGGLLAALVGLVTGGAFARRVHRLAEGLERLGEGKAPSAGLVPTQGALGEPGRALLVAAARVHQRLNELRFRSERLEAVLASLPDGVIVADASRHVILVNPAARSLLSLPAGDEGGALELIGGDRAEGDAREIVHVNERVIRSYSTPVRDADSEELRASVTVLRDATREQELDRLKSEFLTVVSHELQTPLTAIKGALELVLDDDAGQLSRVQRRFLDTIERNCARLAGLVGDLLDLSRLEAGRVELSLQPLDAASLVRGAVAAVVNLFEARGTAVTLDVPEDLPPMLGDRRRVEQILTNLLANAAKYTPPGGQVEVAAQATDGRIVVAVTDSGPGVADAERELVFDKFYRARDAQRRGEAGSGLGLAIVRSLVDLHGGAVRVEAAIGPTGLRGARFVVELPRAADDE